MSELAELLIELGLLLLGLALAGLLARLMQLPAVPFYLLAGLAFGEGGVVGAAGATSFIGVSAEIGVLLLLLVLGMEFSTDELTASLRRHHTSGVVDLVLNAPPGIIGGWLLGWPLPACLAMGGVTWVSSSGIIAQMLEDLGWVGNRETPAVLSLLVIEDVAMAVALPLLAVLLVGGGPGAALTGVLLAASALVLALQVARRAGVVFGHWLSHPDDGQVLLRLLGITLLVAGLAQASGISAAVGAFLVGLAIPTESALRARDLLLPLRNLFAAIFFVSFGLVTHAGELVPVLGVALLLAAVSVVTKTATGWYAAARDGVRRRGRLRAGAALVPRGEFSIVIAGLAGAAGHHEVAVLAAAYVLLVAVAGPVLARVADVATSIVPTPA